MEVFRNLFSKNLGNPENKSNKSNVKKNRVRSHVRYMGLIFNFNVWLGC